MQPRLQALLHTVGTQSARQREDAAGVSLLAPHRRQFHEIRHNRRPHKEIPERRRYRNNECA